MADVFEQELQARTEAVNERILRYLPSEEGFQKTIFEACNYSVINGGKRIRPLLMEAAYQLCGGCEEAVILPFAAAIEMIHSSSLVHDDLPCMDNDRLRRGKPSTWARYGEDMGTLAGDGLMIYAFETACKSAAKPERLARAIRILAEKTGIYGMIGGQTVDVALSGKQPTKEQLDFIYRLKTGALIEASLMIGAVLAGADDETVKRLEEAACCIGLAFQIQDDILDETATEEELGKPVGSDGRNEKTTWLSFFGMEQSKRDVEAYTARAVQLIETAGDAAFLRKLCTYLINRRY